MDILSNRKETNISFAFSFLKFFLFSEGIVTV